MAKIGGLLRPRPKTAPVELDPAELELIEARIADRVARLSGSGTVGAAGGAPSLEAHAASPAEAVLETADGAPAPEPDDPVDDRAPVAGERTGGPLPPIVVERQRYLVPLMARPGGLSVGVTAQPDEADPVAFVAESDGLSVGITADHDPAVAVASASDGWDDLAAGDPAAGGPAAGDPEAGDPDPGAAASVEVPVLPGGGAVDAPTVGEEPARAVPVRTRVGRATPAPRTSEERASAAPPTSEEHASSAPRARRPAARAPRPRSKRAPAFAPPFCPYCATILQPPSATSRRCTQCLHRIVVRRVDGRVVYLTEASVPVFTAERLRIADLGRWTRERQRWLNLAASVGAPVERVARLEAARPSQAVVDAARALYVASVDRSFSAARREHRWEDASRVRRAEALTFHRIAGSPATPPAETVALLREAATAELKGIAKIGREAQLKGATCCDACRSDDHRVFPIAAELRTPRLPHAGCPRGLCRCRWDLTVRHRATVQRHATRRPRPGARASRSEASPSA